MAYAVESTSKVLKMPYVINGGGSVIHSVSNPKDDLTKAGIESLMNECVTDEAILKDNNEAVSIKEPYIVETTKYSIS